MLAHPEHWQGYYRGTEEELRLARRYSLSDRSRYYWTAPRVQAAVQRLLDNLGGEAIPLTLVSQFFPHLAPAVRDGRLEALPQTLVEAAVRRTLRDYSFAAGDPSGTDRHP